MEVPVQDLLGSHSGHWIRLSLSLHQGSTSMLDGFDDVTVFRNLPQLQRGLLLKHS